MRVGVGGAEAAESLGSREPLPTDLRSRGGHHPPDWDHRSTPGSLPILQPINVDFLPPGHCPPGLEEHLGGCGQLQGGGIWGVRGLPVKAGWKAPEREEDEVGTKTMRARV